MEQEKLTQLPVSRIRTVMKTSPSIGQINPDALFLMCRAAELFIEHITKKAHKKEIRNLEYKHLAAYVESEEALEFLIQILPKKITVKQYKKIMEDKKDTDDEDDSSDSEESSDEEEDSGDDDDESGSSSSNESGSVISINSSSSEEKENSQKMGNKKSIPKHKTGDSP
ncbi:chromatin accessibility complex protein 1 [Sabethes cyaneus]|uniref:chromatin accessibility complex protein 1 n=1 Tax=Sabethes cyaneus TaxID=53552 RepID=UPI00237E0CC2|nr:chromatin accessibility complex protein 1 [Sabethes cyaneus]